MSVLLAVVMICSTMPFSVVGSVADESGRSSGTPYATEIGEVVARLREAMKARTETVTLHYQLPLADFDGSVDALKALGDGIMTAALAHTGRPTEGDYLQEDLNRYGVHATISSDAQFYFIDLTYSIVYYTTAEQQRELDAAIDKLLKQFAFSSSDSDYDKVRAIYDYVCEHVAYDYENLDDEQYWLKYTAYAALINKTAVCQGFATLMYRLLLASGVDNRIITGISYNDAHAWNIVKLDGEYYNLDSTWDAGRSSYGYFLRSDASFSNHKRDLEYATDGFVSTYPMSRADYLVPNQGASDVWIDYASPLFSDGKGTAADPYVINTAEELAFLARCVNKEDRHYSYAHYVLGNDIDLAGRRWFPIGVVEGNGWGGSIAVRGFFGEFDGRGHTIRNMQITEAYPSIYQYGLFGMVEGTVQNVTLSDAVVAFECTDEGWQSANGKGSGIDVGVLCGYVTGNGTVQNCHVEDATIDVNAAMSMRCGGAIGSLNYGRAEGVISSGRIVAVSARALWVGGCIGNVADNAFVTTSGFTGTIFAQSDGTVEFDHQEGMVYLHYVGGFCGSAGRSNENVVIQDCYAYADVASVYGKGSQDVGGFAGAIGTIRGKANFENLVFGGTITANRQGVVTEESHFWQGDCGFEPQTGSSEWSYTNCVVMSDKTVTVVNRNDERDETNEYLLSEHTLTALFVDTLGFSEGLWHVDSNHDFTLRNTHVGGSVSHDEVIDAAVVPTCTESGLTAGKHCSVCGAVLVMQNQAPAAGHRFTAYTSNNDATYTEDGTKTAQCDVCDVIETVTDQGSALGLDQRFKDELAAMTQEANMETAYGELYALLQTYALLSEEEKANVTAERESVQRMINEYNQKAQAANRELADATEVAFAPVAAAGFPFLAALWVLLKKRFFI